MVPVPAVDDDVDAYLDAWNELLDAHAWRAHQRSYLTSSSSGRRFFSFGDVVA